MIRIWWCAAAMLFAGAGGAQAQFDQAALDRAQLALQACFSRNATALDDRMSDAATIGRAILANCSAERSAVEEAARGFARASAMSSADRARVREGLLDRATAVVLAQRRRAP